LIWWRAAEYFTLPMRVIMRRDNLSLSFMLYWLNKHGLTRWPAHELMQDFKALRSRNEIAKLAYSVLLPPPFNPYCIWYKRINPTITLISMYRCIMIWVRVKHRVKSVLVKPTIRFDNGECIYVFTVKYCSAIYVSSEMFGLEQLLY